MYSFTWVLSGFCYIPMDGEKEKKLCHVQCLKDVFSNKFCIGY